MSSFTAFSIDALDLYMQMQRMLDPRVAQNWEELGKKAGADTTTCIIPNAFIKERKQ